MVENNVTEKPAEVPSVESFFENRAVRMDNAEFESAQKRLFYLGVFLSALILIGLYAFSPSSRVHAVSVRGNDYLDKTYIQKLSEVSLNDYFYLQFPTAIASKIEADAAVDKADVTLLRDNIVEITVKEKQPIGYRYDNDEPTLLFTDGSICTLTSDYMRMLSRVPFITGFNEEKETHLLTNGFSEVDRAVIESMAEVIQYPLSYDPQAIEIRMRDGGIFFCSYFSMALINDYKRIRILMNDREKCLYADNGTTVAVARACPWDEVKTELEYWTDEEGNYIYNKWGDKAVIHYYQDSNGGYYLDDAGNRIVIPIDAYGSDVKDNDFLNHYIEGWYKNGYLEEPPPEEEGEEGEEGEESGTEEGASEPDGEGQETGPEGTVQEG